jgi:hypothetical protein
MAYWVALSEAISTAWATIKTWHWPIVSAVLSALAVYLIAHVQIIRPWRRRRKLRRPFDAYFLITSVGRFPLNYVLQDNDEHFVKELVVPSNAEISIQIILRPRLSFMQREIYFGCGENLVNKEKPRATKYFVPFVREGERRSGKPDKAHPSHYTDYNGFYHVREDYLYANDDRVIGFYLLTGAIGVYPAQIFVVTDEVRGQADLSIRVEQPPKTKMPCQRKGHRRCLVTPSAQDRGKTLTQ